MVKRQPLIEEIFVPQHDGARPPPAAGSWRYRRTSGEGPHQGEHGVGVGALGRQADIGGVGPLTGDLAQGRRRPSHDRE
jgi:hypothetical protein